MKMKQIKIKDLLNIGLSERYVEGLCLRIKEYNKRKNESTKEKKQQS